MVKPFLSYTTPPKIYGNELYRALGHEWTCPWCQVETAREDGTDDIGWVETPLRKHTPRYICDGCAEDIYEMCARTDFDTHPFREDADRDAAIEGMTVAAFRKICLEDQVRILNSRLQEGDSPENRQRRDNLLALLKQL